MRLVPDDQNLIEAEENSLDLCGTSAHVYVRRRKSKRGYREEPLIVEEKLLAKS